MTIDNQLGIANQTQKLIAWYYSQVLSCNNQLNSSCNYSKYPVVSYSINISRCFKHSTPPAFTSPFFVRHYTLKIILDRWLFIISISQLQKWINKVWTQQAYTNCSSLSSLHPKLFKLDNAHHQTMQIASLKIMVNIKLQKKMTKTNLLTFDCPKK